MQATDMNVINNYPKGEVVKDMFEIKRANEILLSENDVTQDMLEKLEKGEKYVAPLYNYLIEKKGDVRISIVDFDKVHVLGTPEELESFLKEYRP